MTVKRIFAISMARTAIGRRAGSLSGFEAFELGGVAIRAAITNAVVDESAINEVILGNTLASTGNTARVAALAAGISEVVPALTIDRQCGSGINSLTLAARQLREEPGVVIAGGAESMSNEPFLLERSAKAFPATAPKFLRRALSTSEVGDPTMGITAENLRRDYGISREEQDEYALRSQQRYAEHRDLFEQDITPIEVRAKKFTVTVNEDEHPRPETSLDRLSALNPVFESDGTVTAGNASGINDAAAAMLLVDDSFIEQHDIEPLAEIGASAVAGVDPNIMGIGPVPAIHKLLRQTGRHLDDYDLVEINEAFAVQVLACQRELGLDAGKLNVWGGAIAHGHPISATGTILVQKMIRQLQSRGGGRGIVSACIGGGQGIALEIIVR